MKAIISAAGSGRRLRPLTNDLPKSLIEIKGKPILKYALENLSKCGVKDVIIIVGYHADKVKKTLGNQYKDCKIHYYTNNDYDKTDNMYSLWMARNEIDNVFIFLNADILFDPRLLKNLLNNPSPDALIVENNIELEKDSMKVKVIDNKLKAISRTMKDGNGRALGMYKFSPKAAKIYFDEIKNLIANEEFKLTIEKPLANILPNLDMYSITTNGLPWQEVDDAEDLKKARDKIDNFQK